MIRRFLALGVVAALVLTAAAIWMGGLNQDEGWYLYASRLVASGKIPFRDFTFTQGPALPAVYGALYRLWSPFGLLGARILTAIFGLGSVAAFAALAARLAPPGRKSLAALATMFLLGNNLYHLYYLAIPKTYALASLAIGAGYVLVATARPAPPRLRDALCLFGGGLALACAAATRISTGILLAVVGFGLLADCRRRGLGFLYFGLGGALGLALAYGLFVVDPVAREGLVAAQSYHAARGGGFDAVFTVGSISRLVRWYLPVFIFFGLWALWPRRAQSFGDDRLLAKLTLVGFAAVFAVQILAPFPYEDYQVPVMGLLAAFAASGFVRRIDGTPAAATVAATLALGLAWASAFGSPLLESWTTDGQDRFWTLKKKSSELQQLRDVARRIESLDPGGETLLTQDLYLAIETRRRVPEGLEMGPFSELTDDEWRALLDGGERSRVAALSGYTFAIEPPRCTERPMDRQLEYWNILKRRYQLAFREERFGQNATSLLVLKRRSGK